MQGSFCKAFCCALFIFVSASFAQKVDVFSDKYDSYDFNQSLQTEKSEEENVENIEDLTENSKLNVQINPLATTNAIKITIDKEGWYQINQTELTEFGFHIFQNPQTIQLFADGIEQSIIVRSKYIRFYAKPNDTYWTNKKVYWLIQGDNLGKRIETISGGSFNSSANTSSYSNLVERHDRIFRSSVILNGEQDNFYGAAIGSTTIEQTLDLPFPKSNAEIPVLEIAVQGATTNTHNINVKINDRNIDNFTYNYMTRFVRQIPLTEADIQNGLNTIKLVSTSNYFDVSFLEYVRVRYVREAKPKNDYIKFEANANEIIRVDGFNNPKFEVFDITNPSEIKAIDIDRNYNQDETVSFTINSHFENRVILATPRNYRSPLEIKQNKPTNLAHENNEADFIILSHNRFINALEPLRLRRESEGLKTQIVDIEDVYDEFSFGEKSPKAIRDFMQTAKNTWQISPNYLLLVGDSSVDPRAYLPNAEEDLIPIKLIDGGFMEASSDDWLTDFNNDSIGDINVGRFSVKTYSEAENLVNKTLAYENLPNDSLQNRGALMVSDRIEGYNFQAFTDEVRTAFPASLNIAMVNRSQNTVEKVRNEILDEINNGKSVINFLGHGNLLNWTSANLLKTTDVANFQNGANTTIFVMLACLNGAYAETNESLAESLHKTPNGGAIAVWASSGQTYPYGQVVMSKAFYQQIFNIENIRIGDAIKFAKQQNPDLDIRKFSILFGDPTMKIRN